VSDGADVRYAGRLFQILAAETGKACLPSEPRWGCRMHYQLVGGGWSESQSRWQWHVSDAGKRVTSKTYIHTYILLLHRMTERICTRLQKIHIKK